jgi:hypothetical protein
MSEPGKLGEAADEQKLAKARKDQKLLRQLQLKDLEHVMGDAQGRRFVWKLLGDCGVFQSSVKVRADGTISSEDVIFNEGRRDVGLQLTHRLQTQVGELFTDMFRENQIAP